MIGKYMKPEWLSLSFALCLGAGIFLADRWTLSFTYWCLLLCLAVGLTLFAARRRTVFLLVFSLGLLFFSLGAWRLQSVADSYQALPHQAAGAKLVLEGVLKEKGSTYISEKGKVSRYVMAVKKYAYADDGEFQQGSGAAYVTLPEPQTLGTALRVGGDSRPLTYYQNDGMYDAMHRDREKNIWLRLFADERKQAETLAPPGRWQSFLQSLREGLTGRYEAVLGPSYAPVLASLLFGGHYDELPPGLLEAFSATGLIHILSVSGSHVALLLAVIQILGQACRLRPWGLFIFSAAFLLLYGALSDFSSPVVRASLMGAVSALSLSAKRDYLAGHALALAIVGMLLVSPYLFFDLSFRLSCAASAGIILFQKPVSRIFSFLPSFLRDCLTVCVAAQLLVVPLLFRAFFSFPVYSLLANVLVAPMLDLVMVLGLGASVLSLFWGIGADAVLWLVKPLLALALRGNAFIAALPGSRFWASTPSLLTCFGWYLFVAFVFCRSWRRYLCLPLAGCCLAAFLLRPLGPEVLIFDAGRDQVTAMIFADKSADIWYNKTKFSNPDQAAVVVTPALRANGVTRLRHCRVDGDGAEHTLALLQRDFEILSDPGKGDVPFRAFAAVPPVFPDGPLCLEFRSLAGWNGRDFPKEALATVVYGRRRGDEALSEWCETAAFFGVRAFSPARDGQIRLSRKREGWQVSSFVEENA